VINLVLNLLLVPLYGIVGAAVATTISFVGKSIAEDRYLQQIIDIDYPLSETFWIVVAAVLMGICVEFVSRYLVPDSYLTLAAVVFIGFLIYATIVYISTDFDERIAAMTSF
jgi:O-antigen/teichoic acid export membrane protein